MPRIDALDLLHRAVDVRAVSLEVDSVAAERDVFLRSTGRFV